MNRCKESWSDVSGIESGLKDILNAQLLLTKEAARLGGGVARAMMDGLGGAKLCSLRPKRSCCHIPEPCWMPKSLGEVRCKLRAGDSGEICLSITNLDYRSHQYSVQAAGKDAGLVDISQAQFQLGPKERVCVAVTMKVPLVAEQDDQPCCCDQMDVLIWVNGCRNHYLRWVVQTTDRAKCCRHQVCVNDSVDYELHWYDHFFIKRQCIAPATIR
jgi:hypothetical protein